MYVNVMYLRKCKRERNSAVQSPFRTGYGDPGESRFLLDVQKVSQRILWTHTHWIHNEPLLVFLEGGRERRWEGGREREKGGGVRRRRKE